MPCTIAENGEGIILQNHQGLVMSIHIGAAAAAGLAPLPSLTGYMLPSSVLKREPPEASLHRAGLH